MCLEAAMQLTTHIAWPLICAACLGVSAGHRGRFPFIMIGEINERVPEDDRISYFRGSEVRKRFKQLYPGNRLILLLDSCFGVIIICFGDQVVGVQLKTIGISRNLDFAYWFRSCSIEKKSSKIVLKGRPIKSPLSKRPSATG